MRGSELSNVATHGPRRLAAVHRTAGVFENAPVPWLQGLMNHIDRLPTDQLADLVRRINDWLSAQAHGHQ